MATSNKCCVNWIFDQFLPYDDANPDDDDDDDNLSFSVHEEGPALTKQQVLSIVSKTLNKDHFRMAMRHCRRKTKFILYNDIPMGAPFINNFWQIDFEVYEPPRWPCDPTPRPPHFRAYVWRKQIDFFDIHDYCPHELAFACGLTDVHPYLPRPACFSGDPTACSFTNKSPLFSPQHDVGAGNNSIASSSSSSSNSSSSSTVSIDLNDYISRQDFDDDDDDDNDSSKKAENL